MSRIVSDISFGTEEQKERFLKPLHKGDLISSEALTEPRGGLGFLRCDDPR